MEYEEVKKKALTLPWKVVACHAGEECWCRMIDLVTPIPFVMDGEEEVYDNIIHSGSIDGITAQHIVDLHNKSLK